VGLPSQIAKFTIKLESAETPHKLKVYLKLNQHNICVVDVAEKLEYYLEEVEEPV